MTTIFQWWDTFTMMYLKHIFWIWLRLGECLATKIWFTSGKFLKFTNLIGKMKMKNLKYWIKVSKLLNRQSSFWKVRNYPSWSKSFGTTLNISTVRWFNFSSKRIFRNLSSLIKTVPWRKNHEKQLKALDKSWFKSVVFSKVIWTQPLVKIN